MCLVVYARALLQHRIDCRKHGKMKKPALQSGRVGKNLLMFYLLYHEIREECKMGKRGKVCPIMTRTFPGYETLAPIDCLKEECAWWDYKECAVLGLYRTQRFAADRE